MFDMIAPIKKAVKGDSIFLKNTLHGEGHIVANGTCIYFVSLNEDKEIIIASIDSTGTKQFSIPLRSVRKIVHEGNVIYNADPRDLIYGY